MLSSDPITITSTATTSTTGSYYTLSGFNSTSNSGTITLGGVSGAGSGTGYSPCVVNIGAGTSSPCWNGLGSNTTTSFGGINIFGADFVDRMPDLRQIQEMCEQYPALNLAWEKFKTTYRLVKDDYDTSKNPN
jgi:hypothetical protein